MRDRTWRAALLAGCAAMLAGCSTFNRDWAALDQPAAAQAVQDGTELEGRWDGTWHSDASGHDGRLRCITGRDEQGRLQARYRATYMGLLTFEYAVPMTVRSDGATHRFSAEADLGWLAGGRYEYEGTIAGDAFDATYRSAHDHGTFTMRRVP